ncbi:MAG: SDR family NAD(P)-dependent oxidoreductase [Bacteroidota bacterium]
MAKKGNAYAEITEDGVKVFTLPLSKYSDKLELQDANDDKSPEKLQPEYEQELAQYLQMINAIGANSIDKIVYLWGLDNTVNDQTNSEDFTLQSQELFFGGVNTIKALTQANEDYTGQFWFVTQGLERVTGDEAQINFGQGGMYGIMRVLVNEYPGIAVRGVDLENNAASAQWDQLVEEVTTYGEVLKNVEVALRGADRYQRVVTQVSAEDAEERSARVVAATGTWFHADVKSTGDIESIVFREQFQSDLGAEEVLIEVKAAGVSKVDVDIVMNPESEEEAGHGYTGNRLGREASGVVKAVGEKVTGLAVGDEVYGWVHEGVSGMATALERTLAKKPSHISFEEAATITVPFMTAHYALDVLAQLDEGERILIHNANTGIGVAAIHFAQKAGAEVYATAGTEAQREYVKALGVAHVYDPAKTDFYNGILRDTNKEGVDVVLNSLSGEAHTQSLRSLRDFGRFIELSKEDIKRNKQIGLRNFGKNLSYFAVDMDRLVKNKPRVATRIFQEVVRLFEDKTVTPVNPKVFPVADTQEAIKFLADGENIGKVAIAIQDEVSMAPMKTLRLLKNGSYIVSGGAGGLGLTVAHNFAKLGAGTLVLFSRSGRAKTERDQRLIQEMKDMGAKVLMPTGDVSDFERIQEVVAELKDEAPIRGVVHSAALMKDSTFGNMGPGTYYKAFQAKALGAFNLHKAVKDIPTVDFFVPISSISAFVGLPGQSNYSAANNFEDKLSLHRQVSGMRGSSIQYGVLTGKIAGLSREVGEETVLKVLEQQGWDIMSEERILGHMNRLILDQPPFRQHADMNWAQFGEFFSHLTNDSRFADVLKNAKQGSGGEGGGSLLDQLRNLDVDGQNGRLQEEAQAALAKILGTSADKIDIDKSISKIGLDSLMLNQLRNWIQGKLEINFPLMKIAKGPSIIELAGEILKLVDFGGEGAAAKAASSGQPAKAEEVKVYKADTTTVKQIEFKKVDGLLVSTDKWLVAADGVNDDADVQIICMHPMGGEWDMFVEFMANPPAGAKMYSMQQPMRGEGTAVDRSKEKQFANQAELAKAVAAVVKPMLNKPTVLWGHSNGGVAIWEAVRLLEKEGTENLKGMVLSGSASPASFETWQSKELLQQSIRDMTRLYVSLSSMKSNCSRMASIASSLDKPLSFMVVSSEHLFPGGLQ